MSVKCGKPNAQSQTLATPALMLDVGSNSLKKKNIA
jgi:hypothetical protein